MMALGWVVACLVLYAAAGHPVELARQHDVLYRFLLNKWYFDEIYDFLFVRPAMWLGRLLWKGGDGWLIDGFGPDGVSARVLDVTRNVVRLQTGYLYHYAFAMLIGAAALITWFMFWRGALMASWPILSVTTFLPLVGVAVHRAACGEDEAVKRNARWVALWTTLVTFAVSLVLVWRFDPSSPEFQFVEKRAWLGGFGTYHMGVDGISLPFVILTTALMPLCIIASWEPIQTRVKEYMIAFLVLETLMVGTFSALDLVLFYLFFEGGLIPMFLIIGVWGGPRRVYASFKFFLYTLLGSVLMLLAIMAMYWQAGTTDISDAAAPCLPARHADLAVARLLRLVRGQDADVAGAYLAAGRACRGADRGLGDPGRDPAEDGRLRLPALLAADVPVRLAGLRAARVRAVGDRHHLHLAGRAGAGGHEEAHRLFVGRAYGLRDHGHFRRHRAGRRRRHLPDGVARHRVGRAASRRRRPGGSRRTARRTRFRWR